MLLSLRKSKQINKKFPSEDIGLESYVCIFLILALCDDVIMYVSMATIVYNPNPGQPPKKTLANVPVIKKFNRWKVSKFVIVILVNLPLIYPW